VAPAPADLRSCSSGRRAAAPRHAFTMVMPAAALALSTTPQATHGVVQTGITSAVPRARPGIACSWLSVFAAKRV
ncbi:MAG: hypothetical protein AAB403_06935, partial [Planctomycetota bacterium]